MSEWLRIRARQARSGWRLLRTDGPRAVLSRLTPRARQAYRHSPVHWRLTTSSWDWSKVVLPAEPDPLVSIIIPARDHWGVTLRCLRSIARRTAGLKYEVILVDDGSRDRTVRADTIVPGLIRLAMARNVGFVGACQAGAQQARGSFLMFLNNDTIVTDGWLDALLHAIRRPGCGAAGSKLVYPNGLLQEAGSIVWQNGDAYNYGRGEDPDQSAFNYARPVDYCSGAALMVRRDAFEQVGGFDERFAPAYWEDVDLAFKLREAGWSVWFAPASVVCHLEGRSSGVDEARGLKRFQAVNRHVFREKWAATLVEQLPAGSATAWRACSRNRRPVVLIADHHVPMHDKDAGSLFMHRALMTLAADGYRVIFWPDNMSRLPGYAEPLEDLGVQIAYGPLNLEAFLDGLGEPVDVGIAYRAEIATKYLPAFRLRVKALGYVAVDLEAVREARRAGRLGGAPAGVDRLWSREAAAVRIAHAAAVHSPVERMMLEQLVPGRPIFELPLPAAAIAASDRPFADRQGFVFVGSTHPPNVDGISHFVREIWPGVRAALGDVRLTVVGEVCNRVPELARAPGVSLAGHVADLGGVLASARVFVAPLRYGAGIKGKVLSAMQAGVPVITSHVGAEGIHIEHGRSALIADNDAAFSALAVQAYTAPSLWAGLRDEALAVVTHRHGDEPFERAVRQFVEALLAVSRTEPSKRRHLVATK
jgi:GT2 family glycosyltransferase